MRGPSLPCAALFVSFFFVFHIHLLTFFDFELSSSSSFKSKFLSCPSLFFFSRTCFEKHVEKGGCKKKKKKKRRRRKGQRDAFFRTKFKSLVVVCGTLERRHGRRLVKKGTIKKRKEGRNNR